MYYYRYKYLVNGELMMRHEIIALAINECQNRNYKPVNNTIENFCRARACSILRKMGYDIKRVSEV